MSDINDKFTKEMSGCERKLETSKRTQTVNKNEYLNGFEKVQKQIDDMI